MEGGGPSCNNGMRGDPVTWPGAGQVTRVQVPSIVTVSALITGDLEEVITGLGQTTPARWSSEAVQPASVRIL